MCVRGVPVQGAGKEWFVLSLELQCLCFCIIALNLHALVGDAFSQNLRLSVVRYLDAERQSILRAKFLKMQTSNLNNKCQLLP